MPLQIRRCLAALVLGAVLPAAADAPVDQDTYRTGTTYQSTRASTADACALSCANDGRCMAWATTPPTFRVGPRCELKSSVGTSLPMPGHMSGLNAGLSTSADIASAPAPAPAYARAASTPQPTRTAPAPAPVRTSTPAPVNRQPQSLTRPLTQRQAPAPDQPRPLLTERSGASRTQPSISGPLPATRSSAASTDETAPVRRTTRPAPGRSQQSSPAASSPVQTRRPATQVVTRSAAGSPQIAPRTVTRTVSSTPVAEPPPAMIARPANSPSRDPSTYVTKPEVRTSVTTRVPQQSVRTVPVTSTPVPQPAPGTRPLPARAPVAMRDLPSPQDRRVPVYSVQRMGTFPGDVEATSGYIDGVPEDAAVIPIQRDEDEEDDDKKTRDKPKRSNSNDDWPDEYPDPFGEPIDDE